MKNRMLFVAAVVFSFGAKGEAHHQLGKVYTLKETVHVEGKVVRFLLRNPHSYIFLREAGRDEKTWSLEWASAKKLSHQGVHGATIRVGDYLVVSGHPPRKVTEGRILIQSLKHQNDSFTWGERKNETVD